MVDPMRIQVGGGKYTFCKFLEGEQAITILRHGEPWIIQTAGTNAISSIMAELDAARVVLSAARELGDEAPEAIRAALDLHRALVGDEEPPSAWAKP